MNKIRQYLDCPGGHLGRRSFLRVGSLSLLGMSLSQYLRHKSVMAAAGLDAERKATAQSCILIWLEGGPSHVDTWDPKPNSSFKPISTNVAGIQISELLPRVAKCVDKLAIVRSVHTEENNHGQATYYALTGHRPTAAMQFPSFASIITKETGSRSQVPPHVLVPGWKGNGTYEGYLKGAFLAPPMIPWCCPIRARQDFGSRILVCRRICLRIVWNSGAPCSAWLTISTGRRCRWPNTRAWTVSASRR